MVKFSKQMELQLVPEWRHKFCDYWQLKKGIKQIKMQKVPVIEVQEMVGKKLATMEGGTWTPLTSFTRRTMHSRAHEDIIQVHHRKLGDENGGCGGVYETNIVEGVGVENIERDFFKRLDEELNKVDHFFCAKEHEFLERAEILSRQLASLTEIHQAYTNTMSHMTICPPTHSDVASKEISFHFVSCLSSIPCLLQSLLSRNTTNCKDNISSGTFSSTCGHTKYQTGMESEENSTHPLNQNRSGDDEICDEVHDVASQYVININNKDMQAPYMDTNTKHDDSQASYVHIKSNAINKRKRNSLCDDEEDWALDGLFNKESTNHINQDICCNNTSTKGCSYEENLLFNSFDDESSSMSMPARTSISSIISTLSQRLWETQKKEEKEIYKESIHKGKGKGSGLYNSLSSQASLKLGLASMKGTLSMNMEGDRFQLDENCVSLRKIKHARKMLRTAFVEFYRGLGLLRTFSSLNILAFAKILKKYDKVTGRHVSSTYMKVVENAHFSTSDKVVKMMDEVERLFTEHFAKDDEKKAMMLLRPVQNEAPHTITFFLGLFSGSSIALLMAFAIMFHLYEPHTLKENEGTYLETTYQVFGMLFLVLLHMYIYGWNVYAWRKARINYAFIFEFAPKTELHHREILLVCTGLTSMIVAGMLIHLVVYTSARTQVNADMVPLITILAILLLLVCPLNVCYRSSRVYFLRCMKRVVLSPLYKVLLADFFLADQLTSQVATLRSLEFVMCYYFGGFFQSHDTATCGSSEFRFLAYLISFLPYWWRLMQCLRRWIEETDQAHLANGGKYLSAMVAAAARISYSFYPTSWWLAVFVVTSSFATLYQMYWDIVRDWGFFQPRSQNPWLRDQLVLKNKSIYYFSIALNFLLRFAWLQQVTHWQIKCIEHNGTDLFFAALEVIRRGHWNFYRLENEHLNNVGKYRAVKLVPLPFRDYFDMHNI